MMRGLAAGAIVLLAWMLFAAVYILAIDPYKPTPRIANVIVLPLIPVMFLCKWIAAGFGWLFSTKRS